MIGKKISQKMLKDIINLFIFNSFKETINWSFNNFTNLIFWWKKKYYLIIDWQVVNEFIKNVKESLKLNIKMLSLMV